MRREALDGEVVIERKPGYVRVWHRRSARDLDEAQVVLDAMDAALSEWELDRLLFDSREADVSPPDVGAAIWKWLSESENIARVATLLQSAELATKVNLGGIGNDVRIRAFHQEPAAVRWLTILG